MPVVNEVNRAIKRWCRPAMAGKRAVDFVIVTDETSEQLVKRLRPALNEITTILDYRCQTCIDDVVGKEAIDVFGTYVAEAWQELRKRTDPKSVRQPERAETLVIGNMENLDRGTAIKMGIKARRPRKAPQKPDRP